LNAPLTLKLGTRGSKLALWQAHHVRDRLLASGVSAVELVIIKTTGDRIQDVALSQVGGKGLFVKEIEEALLSGAIDLAVHSMKDMPSELPDGLTIGAVPERETPLDAWVLPDGVGFALDPAMAGRADAFLAAVPQGAIIGTSSLRRASQLKVRRPDLDIIPLRGNVDTRLRKLDEREGGLFAIVLACAGLTRLSLGHRISHAIAADVMVPAVGQGALAIETRIGDDRVASALACLEDPETRIATTAERAFLMRLEGNCQVPIGAHATLTGESLRIVGFYGDAPASPTSSGSSGGFASGGPANISTVEMLGHRDDATALGVSLAEALLARHGHAPTARGAA